MKVALYARVSSDQQAEKNNSIPSQLRLLHEYALKHNMEVVKEYVDEGESALSINRPAFEEWIIIKNTHEPIIRKELFDKARRLIEERQPKNTPAQVTASQYLLSGLMRCGKCDGVYGVTGYGRKRKYAYYNCINYSKKGKKVCPGRRLRADELDREVINRVRKLVFSEENMRKLVDNINATTKSLRIDYGRKITELKRKATDLQLRARRQYEAIESGKIDLSLIAERLKELKVQRNSLQEEIAYYKRLNSQYHPVYITRSMIESYRKEMEEVFVGTNVQEQRNFLKKFIEKVIVKDRGIKIVYYTPGVRFPSLALPGV